MQAAARAPAGDAVVNGEDFFTDEERNDWHAVDAIDVHAAAVAAAVSTPASPPLSLAQVRLVLEQGVHAPSSGCRYGGIPPAVSTLTGSSPSACP